MIPRYHVTYWGNESVQVHCYSRKAYTEALSALALLPEYGTPEPTGYGYVRLLLVALGLRTQ